MVVVVVFVVGMRVVWELEAGIVVPRVEGVATWGVREAAGALEAEGAVVGEEGAGGVRGAAGAGEARAEAGLWEVGVWGVW